MRLVESAIPFKPDVVAACELLGLDPLYIANEGKLIAICEKSDAERLLAAMRAHPLGRDAAIIGEVVADPHAFVQMQTRFGGSRMVDWLLGDPLPRILLMHAPYNSFPPGERRLSALPSVLVIDGEVQSVEALERILAGRFRREESHLDRGGGGDPGR